MQDWILIALSAHIIYAGLAISEKLVRTKYFKDSRSMMVFLTLAYSLPALLLPFVNLGGIAPIGILASLFAGVVTVFPFWLYSEAMRKGEISRVAPLWQTIPVFVVVLAYLFIGERLPGNFYLAFALIFAGSLAFSVKNLAGMLKPDKMFWFMMMASFLMATQIIAVKFAYNYAGFLQVLVLLCAGRLAAGIALLGFPSIRSDFSASYRGANKMLLAGMTIISLSALFLYNYALFLGPASIVEVLSGIYPFFVLLFATSVARWAPEALEERVRREDIAMKVFAGALMFIGLALLYV